MPQRRRWGGRNPNFRWPGLLRSSRGSRRIAPEDVSDSTEWSQRSEWSERTGLLAAPTQNGPALVMCNFRILVAAPKYPGLDLGGTFVSVEDISQPHFPRPIGRTGLSRDSGSTSWSPQHEAEGTTTAWRDELRYPLRGATPQGGLDDSLPALKISLCAHSAGGHSVLARAEVRWPRA